ncbi:hypothetical protein EII12_06150 [Buchananella hordeovulneris]|uniref:integrase core domain-containing protein n=1 Tax=Buchananella hordeovulneris TaxID=52770 RepID=UPI000F5F25F2|nr:hypothetical protein EII12_06150 [Buchananella hordeovulneris]
MRRADWQIGKDQVARLMRAAGLTEVVRGRRPRTNAPTTAKDHALQGMVHHSDRGCQYVSMRYTQRLADTGIQASVGSRGDSYDNALAETVNGLYKTELIHATAAWPSVTDVEFHTMCWVDWWNNQRLHQTLDYHTPHEIETLYHPKKDVSPDAPINHQNKTQNATTSWL